jgi:hypothetical protein
MKCLNVVVFVTAVLSMAAQQGFGVIDFNDGGTHDISSAINDDVQVAPDYMDMATTVNFLDGSQILSPYGLEGGLNSIINIYGGSIASWDTTGQLTMSGGIVTNDCSAGGLGQVSILGGVIDGNVTAGHRCHMTMSGGSIGGSLWADDCSVTMSGGSVTGYLTSTGGGEITMAGGSVGGVSAAMGSVTMSGGLVRGRMAAGDGTIKIYGTNFAIDGNSVGFGEITNMLGDGDYKLTGTLANGDMLNNEIRILEGASIVLAPAPKWVQLTINVKPENMGISTVSPFIGTNQFLMNSSVTVGASDSSICPAMWQFDHWEGDGIADVNSATTQVAMDQDKTITAVFKDVRKCGDKCHPNFMVGDLNHDCVVNLADLAILLSRYLECTAPQCD